MRRVVITGMGAVSALGVGVQPLWQGMVEARSAIAPLASPEAGVTLRMKVAAQIRDFDPSVHLDKGEVALMDRVSQLAVVAAREAIAQAGVAFAEKGLGARTAVVIGTGVGGELTRDEQSKRLYRDNAQRVNPLSIVRLMPNAPASLVSIAFGLTGPVFGVVSACASSNHALAQAAMMITHGLADVALAGGSEACLSLSGIRAWEAMRVIADDTCRPFCAQRRGLVLGEGSGMFVLESLEHAQARRAIILAELDGFGMSADAGDIVAPSMHGAARALRGALASARLDPKRIDYINAHGTATPANDPTETRAIREVFGAHADHLAVSSTKGVHGHALGASGALELIAVLGALRENLVPPTANFLDPDPDCDLDYIPNIARERRVDAALSNSFAFGGLNAVLALTRFAG